MNSALFTDFYELTMAQGYWKENMNQKVVFACDYEKNDAKTVIPDKIIHELHDISERRCNYSENC